MNKFQDMLQGGDLRSIGKSNEIIELVKKKTTLTICFLD